LLPWITEADIFLFETLSASTSDLIDNYQFSLSVTTYSLTVISLSFKARGIVQDAG